MFDLDGTLADSLADIAAAGNHMLSKLRRPTIETFRFRYLAGQGVSYLVANALETDEPKLLEEGTRLFRDHYARHRHCHTRPYDGITQLLSVLADRPIKTAVLSNKPHQNTLPLVETLFAPWPFELVRGHQPPVPLKPDPTSALAIARDLSIEPRHWAYLGDTRVDMETAVAAGMFAVGATWGFRDEPELRDAGADAIIHHPTQLLELPEME